MPEGRESVMTGQEAVDYIHSARGKGKKDGLRKITELMHRLGDPQDKLRYVHVVGTNGKGSTTSMIAHSLTAAGYRTGMFISPFILDFRERMQIDGKMISPEALASCVEEVRREADQMAAEGRQPTEFELVCATAFVWFAREQCEVVVLEEAYISSQRNHLDTVASSLDRQLQNSVDRMLLFRQGMHDAIETPLAFDVLQDAVSRFNSVRMLPTWQLAVDKKRTLPINGVSDAFVDKTTLLNRDAERISHEISAALEVGYLLRLASSRAQTEARVIYVSRAGFFLSTDTPDRAGDITARYYNLVTQSWFTQQSERNNRARAVRWFISTPSSWTGDERTITASVPIYFDHYWYGVVRWILH